MPKIGRNQQCPCGSGKKYKHCHGDPIKTDEFNRAVAALDRNLFNRRIKKQYNLAVEKQNEANKNDVQ